MDPRRRMRDDADVGVHAGDGLIEQAQELQFAALIDDVLEHGWCADFKAAHAQLVRLLETSCERPAQRTLCRALLSLTSTALGDIGTARRLARQVIHETARPSGRTPYPTLLLLRRARTLAARSSALIGDCVRGRRAAQARFVADDPESRWLLTANEDGPWQDGPVPVQGFARFINAVQREYATFPAPGPLSPSEVAILEFVEAGKSAPQVAVLLGRSDHTIRTHLRNAYAKLGAHGRHDALVKARALGLLHT
jgi:DNA-binding CsgD family transcriptional regulator/uncharacterized protein YjiS (DUF1127 family)